MPQNVEYNVNAKNGPLEITTILSLIIPMMESQAILQLLAHEKCRTLAKGKEISWLDNSISFDFVNKNPILKTIDDTSNDCTKEYDSINWIFRDTFFSHMCKQRQ